MLQLGSRNQSIFCSKAGLKVIGAHLPIQLCSFADVTSGHWQWNADCFHYNACRALGDVVNGSEQAWNALMQNTVSFNTRLIHPHLTKAKDVHRSERKFSYLHSIKEKQVYFISLLVLQNKGGKPWHTDEQIDDRVTAIGLAFFILKISSTSWYR